MLATHERLRSSTLKIARAKEHLGSLSIEVQRYLDTKPYIIATKRDPDTKRLIYFIENIIPTPIELSVMLGDTIHNLRSALDHLAYQLVSVGTGNTPTNHVYFPIADDEKNTLNNEIVN